MPSDTPLDLDAIEADAIACTARSYGPTIPKLATNVIDLVDALRASRAEVERLRELVEGDAEWRAAFAEWRAAFAEWRAAQPGEVGT